jgi:succinate dehydrogenase / fumarate reductase membrane anchor subunit
MSPKFRPESQESSSWLLMRGSGFLMPTLIIGHLVVQHLLNDVHDLRVEWAAERWNKTGWRVWDGLMLLLAVGHGLRGTCQVIDDYLHKPALNRLARVGVTLLGFGLVAAGLAGLIAFDMDRTLERLEK